MPTEPDFYERSSATEPDPENSKLGVNAPALPATRGEGPRDPREYARSEYARHLREHARLGGK